ncbi:MAG: S8 family peptidase [Firmicutes bacterium]|nr:S8 family peptidase [Bacillota bacterium]
MAPKNYWMGKLSPSLRNIKALSDTDSEQRIIVETMNGRGFDRIAALIDANQGKIHKEIKMLSSLVAELPFSALEELAHSRYVFKIWRDVPVYAQLDVAVPTSGALIPHQAGITGKGVVIAVLDTGIDPHPDLTTPSNRIFAWKDLLNEEDSPYDDNGHGTHVAGIIAGNGRTSGGKYKGIAPDALLVGVKILDEEGSGLLSDVISGIEWCINSLAALNIRVINLSIGSEAQESFRADPLCRVTTAAWRHGITVCAAAGNSGPESATINTPGINPVIITVGNLDDQNTLTNIDDFINPSSSRGPTLEGILKPDLVAPGTRITSLKVGGGYTTLSGTSMATPLVSGAAALILQKWSELKPDQIKRLLLRKARDLGVGPNLQGAGALDLEAIFEEEIEKNRSHNNDTGPNLGGMLLKAFLKLVFKNNSASKRNTNLGNDILKLIVNLLGS